VILILEDEPDIADVLTATLQDAGYTVGVAQTLDAFESLLGSHPDLLLIDLRLGQTWDGLAMVARARLASRRVPIVAMSGYGHDALDLAAQAGASAQLPKPFPPDTLLRVVAGLLAASRRGGDAA
jgi:CheY-like chemotaxis protein